VSRTRPPSAQTISVPRALAADAAQWRYTYDLSTQVHPTSGSTYPILARLAHGPTRDKASNRLPPVSDAARRIQAERAERDGGSRADAR
jgi:hypothetical protein